MSRWIDADAVIADVDKYPYAQGLMDLIADIQTAPSIDIVRCKDCKWCLVEDGGCERIGMVLFADEIENHFCGYGKRREI